MGNPEAQRNVDNRIPFVVLNASFEPLENTLAPGQKPGDATMVEYAKTVEKVLESIDGKVSQHKFMKDSKGNYFRVLDDGKKIPVDKKEMKKLIKQREEAGLTVDMIDESREDIDRG